MEENKTKTTKTDHGSKSGLPRRVLAWAGILVLLALYFVTLIAAIFSSPSANGLFLASLTLTFVIPAAIYIFRWIRQVMKK